MNRITLNYIFISWCILQITFQRFVFAFDEAGRLPVILLFIVIIANWKDRRFRNVFTSKPLFFWGLLSLYTFLNWIVADHYIVNNMPKWAFVCQSMILPYGIMCVVYYTALNDFNKTAQVVLISFVVYLLAGNLLQNHGTGIGTGWSSRGGLILGNRLPLTAMVTAFVICICRLSGCLKKAKYFYFLMALCLYSIVWIATRKAFIGYLIICVFYLLSQIDYKKPSNILMLLFSIVVLYISVTFLMEHSALGVRMNSIEEEGVVFNDTNNYFLNFVGDRAAHYILGWDLFLTHPLMGIGLRNFQYYTNYQVPIHSEYMVQMCENGIIGCFLWLGFFIYTIFICNSYRKKVDESIGLICLGGLISVLFVCFTAWIYDTIYYFVMLGLIIAKCNPIRNRKRIWS